MADRIKGITVEIGGDTTGLSKALSGVNKGDPKHTVAATDVNRLLKLDPANSDPALTKQKLLSQAVGETKRETHAVKIRAGSDGRGPEKRLRHTGTVRRMAA